MQIKISIVKGVKYNTFTAKYATSIGSGQERIKDASLDEIAELTKKIIKNADENGYVGKK